jgi:hypothetical protein
MLGFKRNTDRRQGLRLARALLCACGGYDETWASDTGHFTKKLLLTVGAVLCLAMTVPGVSSAVSMRADSPIVSQKILTPNPTHSSSGQPAPHSCAEWKHGCMELLARPARQPHQLRGSLRPHHWPCTDPDPSPYAVLARGRCGLRRFRRMGAFIHGGPGLSRSPHDQYPLAGKYEDAPAQRSRCPPRCQRTQHVGT